MPTPAHKSAATSVPIHPLLADRWSPRGFDPSHRLSAEDLAALLEAARWAPSASNSQPWRLLPTHRGEEGFDRLFACLAPGNQLWAGEASALVLIATTLRNDDGEDLRWAWYDAGQAAALLTMQATHLGLAVHQMGGFDVAAARAGFALPDTIEPIAVIAVGSFDPSADLPESLAEREASTRARLSLEDLLLP